MFEGKHFLIQHRNNFIIAILLQASSVLELCVQSLFYKRSTLEG